MKKLLTFLFAMFFAVPALADMCPAGYYASGGYTILEYLESSGSQYILTDYVGSLQSRYEGAIYVPSTKDAFYIASRMNSGATRNIAFAHFGNAYIGYGTYTQNSGSLRFSSVVNKEASFVTDYFNMSKSITVNGVTSTKTIDSSEIISNFVNTAPLQIFFNRINGSASTASYNAPSGTRVYYLKIYDTDELVRYYVPVRRNSDSLLGMLDLVSDNFLTNAGSGTFTAGPNIDSIDATCTACANTKPEHSSWIAEATTSTCPWGCNTGYMSNGTSCVVPTISVTVGTTSTNTFKFTMSAKGTFYVDCGNGGTLTSTANDVINNTITRSGTTVATYTCTWGTAGAQTIQFGGTATGYSTGTTTAAIAFYISSGGTQAKISSISGNLSAMFPYKSGVAATGAQPRFYQTFMGATSLTSIPDTLFANYTASSSHMFYYTFYGCTGLTSIPENLFFPNATSVTGQTYMFQNTFYGCTKLTSIPANLFAKVTTSASNMFCGTFQNCTGLTSIPENLFFTNATSVTGQSNMFYSTFYGCKGLTSIPANLFAKVTSGATYMFYQTFQNCTALTSIPENLFFPNATSVTGQSYMFSYTFSGCSGLTTIPANLFFPNATSVTGQSYMFSYTFAGCSGLTTIPTNLFAKITTSATYLFQGVFYNCGGLTSIPENLFFPNATSVSGQTYMFAYAFTSCGKLTSIPENLFANVTSGATYMFYSTFNNCTGLTSIPENLFFPNATSVTGQNNMFNNTFSRCTSLTYIPEKLFSKITSAASNLFYATFSGCTKITGYIPKSTFAGLIANGSPTANYMWQNTFANTQLVSSCPSGTTTIDTTYKGTNQSSDYYVKWGNYAMCEGVSGLDCSIGYYLPANANACSICPLNNICAGGTYTPGANNQGITACASGTFAPTGSAVCYPHIFHVGNDVIYMKSTKRTTPSFNARIGNDIFYINMTTTRTKMNKDSDHYFHIKWGNNHYYVCDDTTCP